MSPQASLAFVDARAWPKSSQDSVIREALKMEGKRTFWEGLPFLSL